MALANRSSPLIVAIAALLFTAGAFAEHGRDALPLLLRPLVSALGLAVLGFLAWCLVSLAWSPFPALSLRMLGEFGPTLIAVYLLARLAPDRLPPWTPMLAAIALALACLFVIASLRLGMAPQRLLGQRDALFVLNRPVLTFVLVAGPLASYFAVARHRRIVAAALLLLAAAAILSSVSGAAAMGLIAGLAMAALAWVLPKRFGLAIVGTGLALALALAPVEGDILARSMPEAIHTRLEHSSSRARVAIAQSFGAAVAADPWRGAGYGTGPRFPEVPAAQALEPEMREMLAVGHPHNSFLQVWAELGVVGAILAAAVLFLTLRGVAVLPKAPFAAAMGLIAAAAAIAFVEHGAWQAWWTAGLGTAITWLRASLARPPRSDTA
ncbi:O-antigen ligase family protein [Methylobacterium haplocladii]|nr:O-antigen ligase family protein [Methylobacterium haplocladii]